MPPLGNVEIYRSSTPPASGIEANVIDRSVLNRQGLTNDQRLTRQLEVDGNRAWMRNVPWPKGWMRAYFTPVTVVSETQLQVGNRVVEFRAEPVSQLELVERVDEQVLTFKWPDGVAQVKVFQGVRGTRLANPETERDIAELSEDEYKKFGGVHLKQQLPPEGCAVHVVSVSYAGAQAAYSAPVSKDYPGLNRVRYDLRVVEEPVGRKGKMEPTTRRALGVWSELQLDEVSFVLVHNAERLPLHLRDGVELVRERRGIAAKTPTQLGPDIEFAGLGGYVRLFVETNREAAHMYAVLDPAIAKLRGN
jgi:hypothetical protein